jgi:hypothetical protein
MKAVNNTNPEDPTGKLPSWRKVAVTHASGLLAIFLFQGCATAPLTNVAPLLHEARQNEVAAYAKNRDRSLHVAGTVFQTGMDAYNRVVADGFAYGPMVSMNAREEIEHYPYMIVGDERASTDDAIKCVFSTNDADVVGKLKPGMKVTFEGKFHQYVHDQGRMILVLSNCSLD